jgi:hypothetical protein
MIDGVEIEVGGRNIDFDLDHGTCAWTLVTEGTADVLDEATFPLIVMSNGKRYELYSDGTFAEVET